jgi:hypothetical protein
MDSFFISLLVCDYLSAHLLLIFLRGLASGFPIHASSNHALATLIKMEPRGLLEQLVTLGTIDAALETV